MIERLAPRRFRKNFHHAWTIAGEWLRGVDFTAFEESPPGQEDRIYPYERSSPRLLLPMLRRTPRGASDAFLDIGCGKGYVLSLVASLGMFARVDGIEISRRLCGIARRNLDKLGIRAGVHNIPAEEFGGYDLYTHFYMFNPCAPDAIVLIAGALAASLRRVPRRAYLFFSHPEGTAVWENLSDSVEQIEGRVDGYAHRLVRFGLSSSKAAAWIPRAGESYP
jgi:SAM-dependent methyltransferase